MDKIVLKDKESCKWDEVSLGEVMLRFDPGNSRVKTARYFNVWEGGGEYNVARGLKRCFNQRTAIVTALPQNDLGMLVQDFIFNGGVDSSHIVWTAYDGIGRTGRVGLNFTERGFGLRGALGVSDRANSCSANLKAGVIDWNKIFKIEKARWFHTGGIFAALSATTPDVVIEALKCARENGVTTSYDLNYRPSLWDGNGGKDNAIRINREIAKYVDVMIGNEEDFTACLGFKVEGVSSNIRGIKTDNFKRMIEQVLKEFPHFKAVGTTLREVEDASFNDWGAILCYGGNFYEAERRENMLIMDRVGGGDSFASGLIYGFLSGSDPQMCVEYGAAHGALAMTTPGDTSMASLKEVENLIRGAGARVVR